MVNTKGAKCVNVMPMKHEITVSACSSKQHIACYFVNAAHLLAVLCMHLFVGCLLPGMCATLHVSCAWVNALHILSVAPFWRDDRRLLQCIQLTTILIEPQTN